MNVYITKLWSEKKHTWGIRKKYICIWEEELRKFNVHGSVQHKNILTYEQQDQTLHS